MIIIGSLQWQSLVNHVVAHVVAHGLATIIYEIIYFQALDIIFYYAAGSQLYLDMVQ
jgi:hypothetical protein